MVRLPPRSTPLYSSAASDVYKRQSKYRNNRVPVAQALVPAVSRLVSTLFKSVPMSGDAAGRSACATSGSMSIQLAVILVPVVFGLMGFALDLGRLYLVRGELHQAAAAAAIAAANQLIGTTTSLDHADAPLLFW